MKNKSNNFILAGNGSYRNRGCEAIAIGTMKILRKYFNKPNFTLASFFQDEDQFKKQRENETDKDVKHIKFEKIKKYDITWFLRNSIGLINSDYKKYFRYRCMKPYINDCLAVLSIGGDNYSLDYGIPIIFTYLDDFALSFKKPIIIWGASVGSFTKDKIFEKYMKEHLKKVSGIFARETITIDYLNSIGIKDNVYYTADPAFLLEAKKPSSTKLKYRIEKNGIGFNLSPLMPKYVTNGNKNKFIDLSVKIIKQVFERTKKKIYLIPHETRNNKNDYIIMKEILSRINNDKIILINPIFNTKETKWIISQLKIFFGARTHATIAAISSGVPTLSFVYSIKSIGINKDIFGTDEYCIYPKHFTPNIILGKIEEMIEDSENIKKRLAQIVPIIQDRALVAGKYLKEILSA